MLSFVLMMLLVVAAAFLILLVLVQRGRGGGLTGALGGMGGQSAFGTKAGDVFTKITIVTAAVWILLCIATDKVLTSSTDRIDPGLGQSTPVEGAEAVDPASGPDGALGTPAGEPSDEPSAEPSTEPAASNDPPAE